MEIAVVEFSLQIISDMSEKQVGFLWSGPGNSMQRHDKRRMLL
jgi:hypothetical protein